MTFVITGLFVVSVFVVIGIYFINFTVKFFSGNFVVALTVSGWGTSMTFVIEGFFVVSVFVVIGI